ncbi:serine/threonine-protein kinase [Micromonospora coxensis]|uniref:serine/threonine-protein kinase n=1 Tax=Micromonospora coxensis TaxID=356852 RepID=UPI0012FE39E7|nr:serine/threonine-protein kinase [Micromonospora coxensis]
MLDDRPVGRGGCGTIWAARDLLFDEKVAVKTVNESLALHGDPRVQRSFVKEAMVGARLGRLSRHVVPVTDLGVADDVPYFVMPWIEPWRDGHIDISPLMGAVSLAQTKTILFEVAEALAVAHANGIVHSDVAPWNVVRSEGDHTYKLADFGLLKILESRLVSIGSGSLLKGGRALFQPPEVRQDISAVSPAADVYALAVTFRVLLEGPDHLRRGGGPHPTPGVVRIRHEQRDAPDQARQLLTRFIDRHSPDDSVDEFVQQLRRVP